MGPDGFGTWFRCTSPMPSRSSIGIMPVNISRRSLKRPSRKPINGTSGCRKSPSGSGREKSNGSSAPADATANRPWQPKPPNAPSLITLTTNNAWIMLTIANRVTGLAVAPSRVPANRSPTARLKIAGARWTLSGAIATAKASAAWLTDGDYFKYPGTLTFDRLILQLLVHPHSWQSKSLAAAF